MEELKVGQQFVGIFYVPDKKKMLRKQSRSFSIEVKVSGILNFLFLFLLYC